MNGRRSWAALMLATGLLMGCDTTTKPRRPPADDSAETIDDLRERRRGNAADDLEPSPTSGGERYADERLPGESHREERRRPDFRDRETSVAEEAEDQRDADADRPLRADEE